MASPEASRLTAPKTSEEVLLSFPAEHILLLTLNRPKSLNAMTPTMQSDIQTVLDWVDNEPSIWVTIITGAGRLFCAGADLKAWNNNQQSGKRSEQEDIASSVHGFGSISRRSTSAKPLIAAVNGGAHGGGTEIVLNCDLVVAGQDAKFALPEVKRGVVAAQGGIPRLVSIAGRQLASELLLLGHTITAQEASTRFGFVNKVVPNGEVLSHAIQWAKDLVQNSPDAVQSTKRAILLSLQHGNVEVATIANAWATESKRNYNSENIKEGLRAFSEKRKPKWTNPAKL